MRSFDDDDISTKRPMTQWRVMEEDIKVAINPETLLPLYECALPHKLKVN